MGCVASTDNPKKQHSNNNTSTTDKHETDQPTSLPTKTLSVTPQTVHNAINYKLHTVSSIPIAIYADSYKASHYLMYPQCELMVCYGEFRSGYLKDKTDTRLIVFGINYLLDNYLNIQWTYNDLYKIELFYSTHNIGNTQFPFPKELFIDFINNNNGYFPVTIEALDDGTVVNAKVPVYQIYARQKYSQLITFLETIMTQMWYPSTVATLSRRCKDIIHDGFIRSVDESSYTLLDSRLHDFGFRGCTCVEQSIIGGTSHLLNFTGSDTMSAAYYTQYQLNLGNPVASSIPATEHSVMTSYIDEQTAIETMIDKFGGPGCVFSIVMDSYDYTNALYNILPRIAARHMNKGGVMVLRPDSGDPVECIIEALTACEKIFGVKINGKGYKVVQHIGVIQGDGININTIRAIIDAVISAGYSTENVAFGMGGGLLQRVNRDTMSFATKLSHAVYNINDERKIIDVMKKPKTDVTKNSYPGIISVVRDDRTGAIQVLPRHDKQTVANNMLKVVYDNGPIKRKLLSFDELKQKVEREWSLCPLTQNVVSAELQLKTDQWIDEFNKRRAADRQAL